jgi:hypothetical protein
VRRLVLPGASKIRVRLANRGSFFLEKALVAHPEISLITSNDADYDVIVCHGCSTLPDGSRNVLLIPPRSQPSQNPAPLVKIAADHPLADGLELAGTVGTTLGPIGLLGSSTIIALSSGIPALVAHEIGLRRVVGLRIDPDSGPFPLSAAFPVLMSNTIRWLANREGNPVALTAGEPLQWQLDAQRRQPVVLDPAGRSIQSALADGILSIADTSTAGIYRVRLDSGDRMFAVNPAVRGESDLSAVSPPGRAADAALAVGVEHKDVTAIFILAALSLLALEWRCRLTGTLQA